VEEELPYHTEEQNLWKLWGKLVQGVLVERVETSAAAGRLDVEIVDSLNRRGRVVLEWEDHNWQDYRKIGLESVQRVSQPWEKQATEVGHDE
jgi:hypothetical protein